MTEPLAPHGPPPSALLQQAASSDQSFKPLLDQLRALWKFRWFMLAVTAAVTALVTTWTLRQPKIYAARTSLEFDPNPPRPLGRQVEAVVDETPSFWLTREYYTTQQRIIESQRLAEAVVRQLGLQHDADFFGTPARMVSQFRSRTVEQAAQTLRTRVRVEPVRDSRIVYVRAEDTSPRRAQLIANTVAMVYMRQNLESRLSTTVSALEWLGQQRETLRDRLYRSEDELHEYRRQNNLLSTSFEDRRNHVGNRIQKLSDDLTEAQSRRIQIAARLQELRRAAQTADPLEMRAPELLASQPLQNLRTHLEELRRERAGLVTRYGPNAAQMQAVESRIEEITTATRAEVRNVLGSAEAEHRSIQRIEGNLRAALGQAQLEGLELNLREIQYQRLHRERENNAKLYAVVLERATETDLTRMLRVNNVRIIDEALLPAAPVSPRVPVNIAIGVLAGSVLGVLLAFLAIQADRTVRSQIDVEEHLRVAFLGVLPRVFSRGMRAKLRLGYRYGKGPRDNDKPLQNPDLVVHSHPSSSVAEACRVVRTNLLFMSPDDPLKTIMVASAEPRDGKTFSAVSLAITLAQSGKRVLLIDTDMRRPRVHRVFGMHPPVGITSVLVNEATLDDAVQPSEVPNLSVLPCGPIPPNPSELLHSQRFRELLAEVRNRFDRVVFDTPPVGAVTDALIIGPQVDGAILVVRARKTIRARAAGIVAQMTGLGTRLAGVLLNDVELGRESDSAYYYYSSGYEYSANSSD